MASGSENGRDPKRSRNEKHVDENEVIMLDGEERAGSVEEPKKTARSRPSRKSEYLSPFGPAPPPVLEELLKTMKNTPKKILPGRTRSGAIAAKSLEATINDLEASTSAAGNDEPIDLCDDEEDEEKVAPVSPVTWNANQSGNNVVPEGAHWIFHQLHNFKEVGLVDSLVTHGDLYQLAKGQMLGDGLIQFMVEVTKYSRPLEDQKTTHIFPYFFFHTYMNAMKGRSEKLDVIPAELLERIRKYTKVDIFTFEHLIIPVLYE